MARAVRALGCSGGQALFHPPGGPGWVSPPEMGPRAQNQLPPLCVQETLIPSGRPPWKQRGPDSAPWGVQASWSFPSAGMREGTVSRPHPPHPPCCSRSPCQHRLLEPQSQPKILGATVQGCQGASAGPGRLGLRSWEDGGDPGNGREH